MGVIVIYDSFIHLTPLYYVLFFALGRMAGIIYRLVFKIEKPQDEAFEIRTNRWNILLTAVLLFLHFLGGRFLLESVNIVWVKDALYLFFIGLYLTKLKIIIRQIDEFIYGSLLRKDTYK